MTKTPFSAIAALMQVLNQPKILVGVGGALIQYHPTYHAMLKEKLSELLPPVVVEVRTVLIIFIPSSHQPVYLHLLFQWDLVPAEDGSGRGAALIAAIAERLQL